MTVGESKVARDGKGNAACERTQKGGERRRGHIKAARIGRQQQHEPMQECHGDKVGLAVACERRTTDDAVMIKKVSPRRMSGLASALEEKKKSSLFTRERTDRSIMCEVILRTRER